MGRLFPTKILRGWERSHSTTVCQYFDKETGLHQNWFRDYDPAIGRYIESDPLGLSAGFNTYAYVGSDPFQRTDRLGLSLCDVRAAFEAVRSNTRLRLPAGSWSFDFNPARPRDDLGDYARGPYIDFFNNQVPADHIRLHGNFAADNFRDKVILA